MKHIQLVSMLSLSCILGCSTSSPAHFSGSLDDIKNEQRSRLFRQCLIENEDQLFVPDMAMYLTASCREWGQRMVR